MRPWLLLLPLSLAPPAAFAGGEDDDDDARETRIEFDAVEVSAPRMKVAAPAAQFAPDMPMGADGLSATAGGAQDIAWFRSQVMAGVLPDPASFTAEGLLSEHDLPARQTGPCPRLLCVLGEATLTDIPGHDEATVLAQLGFASSLTAASYVRPPLNLVVVLDQSASMSGEAWRTQLTSVLVLSAQLREVDQIELITVDSEARVALPPTAGDDRDALRRALGNLEPWGQTRLYAGVELAFEEAQRSARSFSGLSRVIVLSDQRPTTGARDPEAFIRLAQRGAAAGVGLTTVAVGREPDFELVSQLSRVRGGNAYGFPDLARMLEVFAEELDTLTVALAYELALEVAPAPGWRLVGVYGVPGAALRWDSAGAARLFVDTLFLSSKGGAIYFALAPEGVSSMPAAPARPGAAVATVGLSYQPIDGDRVLDTVGMQITAHPPSLGLTRGRLLVGEIEGVRAALEVPSGQRSLSEAREALDAAKRALVEAGDPSLAGEAELLAGLERALWSAGY